MYENCILLNNTLADGTIETLSPDLRQTYNWLSRVKAIPDTGKSMITALKPLLSHGYLLLLIMNKNYKISKLIYWQR